MTSNTNVDFYNKNAASLNEMYSNQPFSTIHNSWSHLLKHVPLKSYALDVGAGNGRDALALSAMGYDVTAVKPATNLSEFARKIPSDVTWLDDSLPALNLVKQESKRFSIILLSAVWMHLTDKEQAETLKTLSGMLSESGIIVISLRHGDFSDGRTTSHPTIEGLDALLPANNLKKIHETQSNDKLKRGDVSWSTVVLADINR